MGVWCVHIHALECDMKCVSHSRLKSNILERHSLIDYIEKTDNDR